MTKVEADALLDAFLAAKAAGQEELWRETHPAAPDGPTVLILWLMARGVCGGANLVCAIKAVDEGCAVRMAIYAAIAAHPVWVKYRGALDEKYHAAPGAAIRAAIAYYQDPTEDNRRAVRYARAAADSAAHAAYSTSNAIRSANAAYAATSARNAYTGHCATAAEDAAYAATRAEIALGDAGKVINVLVAAIADHYEGRPLEMP